MNTSEPSGTVVVPVDDREDLSSEDEQELVYILTHAAWQDFAERRGFRTEGVELCPPEASLVYAWSNFAKRRPVQWADILEPPGLHGCTDVMVRNYPLYPGYPLDDDVKRVAGAMWRGLARWSKEMARSDA